MGPESTPPKFLILTLGCQMNKNDSERIARILTDAGFAPTDDEADADVIIMNTCSVRQSAEDRVYGKMEDFIALKRKKPHLLLAVTGCMAGRDTDGAIRKRLSAVDFFFPTADMVRLPAWIAERWMSGAVRSYSASYLDVRPLRHPSASAFVTIQTGCDKYCAYCVVPYARGRETNRPVADILGEIRACAESGIIDITLLGQSVNSFRAPAGSFSDANPYSDPFAALLWEANQVPGIERIHWTAAHPISMTDEVIDALALPKQVDYLHLPVQSGSDEVLRRMNRKYTRQRFLDILAKVKARRPGIAIGTDIIVGFPGETAAQFDETVSLYREADFDIAYQAEYSTRTGTLAAKIYPDDVPAAEKRRRWQVIQDLMEQTAKRKNQAFVGKTLRVLVASVSGGYATGTTDELKTCRFPCENEAFVGQMLPVRVVEALEWQLSGDMLR